jgi:hypothetical protein
MHAPSKSGVNRIWQFRRTAQRVVLRNPPSQLKTMRITPSLLQPFNPRGSAPGGGRTHNLCLRRATLYPVELRVRFGSADRANLLWMFQHPQAMSSLFERSYPTPPLNRRKLQRAYRPLSSTAGMATKLREAGGRGGIRTRGEFNPTLDFESSALNRTQPPFLDYSFKHEALTRNPQP